MRTKLLNIALLAAFCAAPMVATAANQTVNVQFPRGGTGMAYDGRVQGSDMVTYTLRASAGQTLSVTLSSSNAATNYVVIAPDGEAPLFDSSSSDEDFLRRLEDTGVYKVQVFLMRNAARRGVAADYTIDFNVTGRAARAATSIDNDSGEWVVTGLASGDYLNLRSSPSTRGRLLSQVSNGQRLRDLGCNANGWCKVELDNSNEGNPNVIGWAAQRYLSED